MTEDQAKRRFMLLNLVRLIGLAMVMVGFANVSGKLLPEFAPNLGYVLLVAGLADFFLAPILLKKAWRDQP